MAVCSQGKNWARGEDQIQENASKTWCGPEE